MKAAFDEHYPVKTMEVHKTGDTARPRRLTFFASAAAGVSFGCHNKDLDTVERGLLERVFLHRDGDRWVPPYVPPLGEYSRALAPFTRAYQRRARGLTAMTNAEFVASCDSRKRAIYEKARVDVELDGLLERDYRLDTFVKFEKLNLTKKSDPAPRVIQPRSPKFNISVGVFIRPLEGVVYRNIARIFKSTTVLKGLNALQRGAVLRRKWDRFKRPVAVKFDANRFDEHVHEEALRYEHSIYNRRHFNSREFARLLRRQIRQKGIARCIDGIIRYVVRGRRASGDMNTSCGNCLLMCAMVYSFLSDQDLVDDDGDCAFELADDGDDGVLILEADDLARLEGVGDWFRRMGFPLTVDDPVYEFEMIEFCQTHPVFDGSAWVMMRDPRICLDKDLCTTKQVPDEKSWNTLRNSVAQCGASLAGNMPVFCEFYRFLGRGAGERVDADLTMTGFKYLARGMDARGPVTDDCRLSFARAFGISVPEQLHLEQHYRSVRPVFSLPEEVPFCPFHPGAMGSVY